MSEALVIEALTAAIGSDNDSRAAAEAALGGWESNASPGFIASLVKVVQHTEAVPAPARLLAAIVAKNAVGSSWRKTMGTKEWSFVPAEEKAFIRSGVGARNAFPPAPACPRHTSALRSDSCLPGRAESLLMSEPTEQVALQLGLLIANMAHFDFPSEWPHLLSGLVGCAAWEDASNTPEAKRRAMRTTKQVTLALSRKRPSINSAEQSDATIAGTLQELVDSRLEELKQMRTTAVASFGAVRQQCIGHVEAVIAGGAEQEVAMRVKMGTTSCRVLAAMIKMLSSISSPAAAATEVGSPPRLAGTESGLLASFR